MLGGNEHGFYVHRPGSFVIHSNLHFSVGPQIGNDAGFAHFGQPFGEAVREADGKRHQGVGVATGVAEHHALIACALLVYVAFGCSSSLLQGAIHAVGYFGRLLGDADHHPAGVAVVAEVVAVVADVADGVASQLLNVYPSAGGDFAGDDA